MSTEKESHKFSKPPQWSDFNPKVNPDMQPDNRLWLKQWDAPFSPESPEAIAWAIEQGWGDADDWRASDLYRRGMEQFNEREGAES